MNKTRKSNAGVQEGYFGQFGGAFVSETLKKELDRVYAEYLKLKKDESFRAELSLLQRTYQGRTYSLILLQKTFRANGRGGHLFEERISIIRARTKSITVSAKFCSPNTWARTR